MSEYQKIKQEERELGEKLDEIAAHRAKQRREESKKSYAMHTPPEAMRNLGYNGYGKKGLKWW